MSNKILYINKNVPAEKKTKWTRITNLFFELVRQKSKLRRKPQQNKVSSVRPTNPIVYTESEPQLANFYEMPRWRQYHLDSNGPDIPLGVQYPIGDPRRYGFDPSRFKKMSARPKPAIQQETVVKTQYQEAQTQILKSDSVETEINPQYSTSLKTKVISGTISDLYPSKPRSADRHYNLVNQRPRRVKEVLLPKKHYHLSA